MSENTKEVIADEIQEEVQEAMNEEKVENTTVSQEEETNPSDALEEALKKITELEEKLQESDNRYLRLQADMDNMRRRNRLDMEAKEKYRAQKLVTELLPALDNFERALNIQTDNEQVKTVMQGMVMIHRSLLDAIKSEGVTPIEAINQEFDPNFHHAVMQEEVEGVEANIVVEELQKGYVLKDRVIRPAMVKVSM